MFNALNTHAVGLSGLIVVLIALYSDPGFQNAWGSVIKAFPGAGGKPPTASDWVHFAISVGILIGAVAAYFGRPKNVPAGDVKPVPAPAAAKRR